MPRASLVVVALSATVAVVVASVSLLRPTGTETGSDGEDAREAVIVLDSVKVPEPREIILAAHEDSRDGRAFRRAEPESERRAKRPTVTWPAREHDDVGEYLDPDALYPVSPYGGSVVDVGEFQDPERDVPTAPPHEGISDVGEYLDPEEGP